MHVRTIDTWIIPLGVNLPSFILCGLLGLASMAADSALASESSLGMETSTGSLSFFIRSSGVGDRDGEWEELRLEKVSSNSRDWGRDDLL